MIVSDSLPLFILNEDIKAAKNILKKMHIPPDNKEFKEIVDMLQRHPNYVQKFTEWFFIKRDSMEELRSVYDLLATTSVKVNIYEKLPKPKEGQQQPERQGFPGMPERERGMPDAEGRFAKPKKQVVPYKFEHAEQLYDYLVNAALDKKVTQVIKRLPSRTREAVASFQPLIELLRSTLTDKPNLAPYIGSYFATSGGRNMYKDSPQLLVDDTEGYIDGITGDWNLAAKLDDMDKWKKDKDYQLIVASPSMLVLECKTYEFSKAFGSQNWCISTQQSYFNSYADVFSRQYFVLDFTKKPSDNASLIGATIGADGAIREAEYKNNSHSHNKYGSVNNYLEELFDGVVPNGEKFDRSKIRSDQLPK